MDTEQKAKAYDEALKVARYIHDVTPSSSIAIAVCEQIFPELKESEDEKGKRILHSISSKISFHLRDIFTEEEFQCFDTWSNACLEKQGVEKLTVEPKFKVGDWVVYDHRPYQIVELPKEGYINLGLRGNGKIEFAPSTYCRHWTIQDAKDGDVLYHKAENGIEYIVMNKGLNEHNNIDSYFRYNSVNGFGTDIPSVLSAKCDSITPATKEQRDLLFSKMHEAGYEWDAEKKELKKIEQKPAWGEEDEEMLENIIDDYDDAEEHNLSDDIGKVMWLKSIKQRIGG